ncbi:MAG: DEDD exonuclease domain-containing protein, partial [Nocardioides sp.]
MTSLAATEGARGAPPRWGSQESLDDLGRPLSEVTFCVVDLETTGPNSSGGDRITEVGAVKVRAGQILGEFQTLVNPHQRIAPFIAVLTGICDSMVASAPGIDAVLPAFLEFAGDSVLVAHNAPFDVGFLKQAASELGYRWPGFEVVDTVKLARHVVTKDEAPNHKLGSLAKVFRAETTPNHRALADARATVDVLHGLIGRLGGLGVQTLEDLQGYSSKTYAAQRRKQHLADGLPHAPGVYLFRDPTGQVLYIGTSKDLKARVRNYFTASETRSRIGEMVRLADRVDHVVCATQLEAAVRELRLIATHKPPYNRRSKFPEKSHFVSLTDEAWPRLTVTRQAGTHAPVLGPFPSRKAAIRVVDILESTFPIRRCTQRLPLVPASTACVQAELGQCLSPCDGSTDSDTYAQLIRSVGASLSHDLEPVGEFADTRMRQLSTEERFEEAALIRDQQAAYATSVRRTQQLAGLSAVAELVIAQRVDLGRWEVHVIRHGRLAAAGVIPTDANA